MGSTLKYKSFSGFPSLIRIKKTLLKEEEEKKK